MPGRRQRRLITSQIDTAPKQAFRTEYQAFSLITSQIDTAPKQVLHDQLDGGQFDYQSD